MWLSDKTRCVCDRRWVWEKQSKNDVCRQQKQTIKEISGKTQTQVIGLECIVDWKSPILHHRGGCHHHRLWHRELNCVIAKANCNIEISPFFRLQTQKGMTKNEMPFSYGG